MIASPISLCGVQQGFPQQAPKIGKPYPSACSPWSCLQFRCLPFEASVHTLGHQGMHSPAAA